MERRVPTWILLRIAFKEVRRSHPVLSSVFVPNLARDGVLQDAFAVKLNMDPGAFMSHASASVLHTPALPNFF